MVLGLLWEGFGTVFSDGCWKVWGRFGESSQGCLGLFWDEFRNVLEALQKCLGSFLMFRLFLDSFYMVLGLLLGPHKAAWDGCHKVWGVLWGPHKAAWDGFWMVFGMFCKPHRLKNKPILCRNLVGRSRVDMVQGVPRHDVDPPIDDVVPCRMSMFPTTRATHYASSGLMGRSWGLLGALGVVLGYQNDLRNRSVPPGFAKQAISMH